MTNQENVTGPQPETSGEYRAGQRSITQRATKSRFEMLREKKERGKRGRPFFYGSIAIVLGLMIVLGVAFWNEFVAPPKAVAIRVGEVEYTRGDVVDLIRFNQRLSEESGIPFQLGTSVFEALQIIQEAELAFQLAPQFGVSVSPEEVDERINFILGFALTANDQSPDELQVNVEEEKIQFLNRVGLPEEVWREFLRKILFQERLREVIGDNIPRIQPQVHVYQIFLPRNDPQAVALIERELNAGANIEDIVLEFSVGPDARRDRGDLGWMPEGIVAAQIDRLLFGTNEDGNRILPLRTPSNPQLDSETNLWSVIVVEEFQEARELDPQVLELLKDRAMTIFMNEQSRAYGANGDLFLDLDNEIVDWVNKQVSLNSIQATPDPSQAQDPLQGLLPGASFTDPSRPQATPVGIPGINSPVQ